MKVGDILYASWGYEQTNIDFYEVVKATAKTVTVWKLKSEKTYTGQMTGTAKPILGAYAETRRNELKDIRRKVCQYSDREFISITDYANAYPYDNKPKVFSTYG